MVDYAKIDYQYQTHHQRFVHRVETTGDSLLCQECGGAGGWIEIVYEGSGPWEPCGFCEGTGKTTRHLRGVWLAYKRDEARSRKAIQ